MWTLAVFMELLGTTKHDISEQGNNERNQTDKLSWCKIFQFILARIKGLCVWMTFCMIFHVVRLLLIDRLDRNLSLSEPRNRENRYCKPQLAVKIKILLWSSGKLKGKGSTQEVDCQLSIIDCWLSISISLKLYTKVGRHPPPPTRTFNFT